MKKHILVDRLPTTFHLILLALAVLGIVLVLIDTRWGAYLSDDSYYYIAPAQGLLEGKGFEPSYIFAPMFPLALTGISLMGVNTLSAARLLNAFLFGLNIFLVGMTTRRMNVSVGFSLVAAGMVLLSDVVVEAHGWAMSEALAFTFMLLSLFLTQVYLASGRQVYWWAAACTAALTVLTRYAALPLIGAISLTMLVFYPSFGLWRRIRQSVLFGFVSLAPIALYWLRNVVVSGHPVRYQQFSLLPLTHDQLIWFLYHWLSLFVPGRFLHGREVAAAVFVLSFGGVVTAWLTWKTKSKWLRSGNRDFKIGMFLLVTVLLLNLVMLYLSRGLTELDVLNPRYLVPMLIVVMMMIAACGDLLWQTGGSIVKIGLAGFFVIFILYYGYRTLDFSRMVFNTGLGYSNVGWHNSETVAYINNHPEIKNMVSTGEMGIYFWTGRMPISLAAYPDQPGLKKFLCQNNAPLFVMDQMPTEIYSVSNQMVVDTFKLAHTFNDSKMYVCLNP